MSSSPTYLSREDLSSFLLQPVDTRPSMAIVDVRDDDHVGGHIYTSTHVPSLSLDYKIPELVRTLKDVEIVVFHCALSQQRGPTAARRYVRERSKILAGSENSPATGPSDSKTVCTKESEGMTHTAKTQQKVYILDGGFVKWQEKLVHPI